MRKTTKWLLGIFGVIVAALAAVFVFVLSPILTSGSGYSAKQLCSAHFLSGMPGDQILDEALIGASPILGNTSFTFDEEQGAVETRLFGLFPRKAVFVAEQGCTLVPPKAETPAPVVQADAESVPAEFAFDAPEADPALDAILAKHFVEVDPEAPLNTKAIVVVKDGKLLAEHYAEGLTKDSPLTGWSMTKSVTSLLHGILTADGKLDVMAPAPVALWNAEPNDPRAAITTDQLLRMSSGLEFHEEYGIQTDVTIMLTVQPDMARFAADKPLLHAPDTHWEYSSGTTVILSRIAQEALGGTPDDFETFASKRLFTPLGMTSATMEFDASGTFVGSSYLYATPRDWAKLGMLVLQKGAWNGAQLVPESWIDYATTPTPTNPDNNYGAQFWLNRDPSNSEATRSMPNVPTDTVMMQGYQGQHVIMVPSENLVIVRLGITPKRNHDMDDLVSSVLKHLAEKG